MDDVLGPVFEAAHVNWNAHIATLIDFWSWQLLGEPGYDGQPLRAHEPVHARTPLVARALRRWIELFCDTIDTSFDGPRAEIAKAAVARWRQRWNGCWRGCRRMVPTRRADVAARRECLTTLAISQLSSDLGFAVSSSRTLDRRGVAWGLSVSRS